MHRYFTETIFIPATLSLVFSCIRPQEQLVAYRDDDIPSQQIDNPVHLKQSGLQYASGSFASNTSSSASGSSGVFTEHGKLLLII